MYPTSSGGPLKSSQARPSSIQSATSTSSPPRPGSQALRYRNLTEVVAYRERHEHDEHKAIRDAVLDRNADRAVELLIAHFKVTADIVMSSGALT